MELTTEQQQALQNLTKAFSSTNSQSFNRFFQDELADLETLERRQSDINSEIKELMQYSDTSVANIIDLVEEFSINQREIKRINNRLQMARNLLVELGVTLT